MTRYWWTSREMDFDADELRQTQKLYPDISAYYECERIAALYLKALQFAKKPKAKALCLGMAGRCEHYKLRFRQEMGMPAASANR